MKQTVLSLAFALALTAVLPHFAHAYTVDCPTLPKVCNMTGFTIEAEERAPSAQTPKLATDTTWLLYGIEAGTGSAMSLHWALIDSATPEENRWLYSFREGQDGQLTVEVDFDRSIVKTYCVSGQEIVLNNCAIDRRANPR